MNADAAPVTHPVVILLGLWGLPLLAALGMRRLSVWLPGVQGLIGPLALVFGALMGLWAWNDALVGPVILRLGPEHGHVGLLLRLDALGILLATLGLMAVLLYWNRAEDHPDPAGRDAARLFFAAGLVGLALAGDWLVAWVSLEQCAASAAALLLLPGTLRARVAMLNYWRLSAAGSLLAMSGIGLVMVYAAGVDSGSAQGSGSGSGSGALGATVWGLIGGGLVALGFGAKTLLFPLNHWLMQAARAAPSTVLALLTGMLPMLALLSLARLLNTGEQTSITLAPLMGLGLVSMVTGTLGMWRADEFRIFVSQFSSASAGLVAVVLAIAGPAALVAGLAVMLHFLLLHSMLFMLARHWRRRIAGLAGIAWRTPVLIGLLGLLAASMLGVPPLPGFWVKLCVFLTLADWTGPWQAVIVTVSVVTLIGQAMAWLRLFGVLYTKPTIVTEPDHPVTTVRADLLPALLLPGRLDQALGALLAAVLLVAMVMVGPLSGALKDLAAPSLSGPVQPLAEVPLATLSELRGSPWPEPDL